MKFIRFLIIPILCMILVVNAAASSVGNGVYEFVDEDKVVTFNEDSILSAEEQQMIAEYLVYGEKNEDDGASTYAWCWLTGHDYKYEVVTVTTHKKRAISPRCYEETYSVETCTKCDHLEEELVGGVYILCCPEE